MSAALLASLFATAVAPTALGAASNTSVGTVLRGTTSTNTVSFTLTEEGKALFPHTTITPTDPNPGSAFADPTAYVSITITDSASAATVSFTGTPVVSAPGSLGATATISGANPNVLWVKIVDSDVNNVEAITVSGLNIKAAAGAALGAMKATIAAGKSPTPATAADTAFYNALLPSTCNASGKVSSATGVGATSFTVALDTGSCDFQAPATGAGPAGSIIVGSGATQETLTAATTAPSGGTGLQTITLVTPASFAFNHLANEVVTQADVNFTGTLTLTSPGTVADKVEYEGPSPLPIVRNGRNFQSAGDVTVTELTLGYLASGTTLTFTIGTAGVLFSDAPSVSGTGGIAFGAPALSVDRKSFTVKVTTASTSPSVVTVTSIDYDIDSSVAPGTQIALGLSLSGGLNTDPASVNNAVIGFAIQPTADQPTVYIGFNGQNSGMITFKEAGAGFFTDGTGGNNKFEICITSNYEAFTSAPWAIVTAGDLKLLGSGSTAVTQLKGTADGSCYYWSVYSASTVASTVVIVGTDPANPTAPLAPGPGHGPQINVYSYAPPGTTQMTLYTGSILGSMQTQGSVANAIRAFKNTLSVVALSTPSIAPGALSAPAGDLQLTETQPGQLDYGDMICVEVIPRTSTTAIQARRDVFLGAANTNDLPKISTNGTTSGLLASQVQAYGGGFFDEGQSECSRFASGFDFGISLGQTATAFAFSITQGSFNALGQITITNIKYSALADAANGPVQVNVFVIPDAGIQESQGLVSNAKIGSGIGGTAGTALGVTSVGPFSTSTKVQKVGKYVTYRFDFGFGAAGKAVQIWGSTKTGADWSPWAVVTTRIANASGVVYYYVRQSSATWKSYRGAWVSGGLMTPARQARWK